MMMMMMISVKVYTGELQFQYVVSGGRGIREGIYSEKKNPSFVFSDSFMVF